MLKKISFILLFLLIFPVYVHSDSIDYPYYLGLVTTDGATTVNDGNWKQYNVVGHNRSFDGGWTGFWEAEGAETVRLLDNGAIAVLEWWYDGGTSTFVLDNADIFRVNQDTLVCYGGYCFEDSQAELFDNPQRFSRLWTTGETFNITETIGADTETTAITFERKGVTVSANAVPGTSAVTDCALIHTYRYSESSSEFDFATEILAPGRGDVAVVVHMSETNSIEVESKDEITAWGVGSYPAYMTADFPAALATLNTLVLSDANIVDVRPTGGTKVIVIPMN